MCDVFFLGTARSTESHTSDRIEGIGMIMAGKKEARPDPMAVHEVSARSDDCDSVESVFRNSGKGNARSAIAGERQ